MKKIAVISLVIIMLALSVIPALAKGPAQNSGSGTGVCSGAQSPSGTGMQFGLGSGSKYEYGAGSQNGFGVSSPYALSGTIAGLDADNHTVKVSVVCGNRLVYPYFDQDVTLVTTDATRFLLRNENGQATPISFDDLIVGQNISSHGTLVDNVFTATRLTVGALITCLP